MSKLNLALLTALLVSFSFVTSAFAKIPSLMPSSDSPTVVSEPLLCEGDSCSLPPQPVTGGFSYGKAAQLFHKGRPPTANALQGNWINVGFSVSPEALAVFQGTGDAKSVGYNPNGLTNSDGSLARLLTFSAVQSEFENGLSILIQNLGRQNNNQGPYTMLLKTTGACFSSYAYTNTAALSQNYYEFECRQSKSHLICRTIFRMVDPTGISSAMVSLNGRTMHYLAFVKQ